MKQVVQPIGGGPVQVIEVPAPVIDEQQVLVETTHSIVSPGTEAAVTALAQSSLLAKARARPELVRDVLRKARDQGVRETVETVRSRLGSDVPLGYSASGHVLEVGAAVDRIRPGQLVATAGAGWANHAEYQAVPHLLCAPVPDTVTAADAAFATVGSIALHALRLAEVGPGARVVVIGLGLIGQLATRLALAAGCHVAGLDLSEARLGAAARAGALALVDQGDATTDRILDWSRGRGADAVLLCARDATSRVATRAPALCRDRGTLVVVGDIGLELERQPLYERELSVRISRSYGPGRGDPRYERLGSDYPIGYVRWTEGRNLEAFLDLLASDRLAVGDLVTHSFPISDAASAYGLLQQRDESSLAIRLDYPTRAPRDIAVPIRNAPDGSTPGIGVIGAGAFTAGVLLPALRHAGVDRFVAVTSASGLTARRLAERQGFARAVQGADAVLSDPDVDVVVVSTPHADHARLAIAALEAEKHVWCEKPPAITTEELDAIVEAWQASGRALMIGFNRRWSPMVTEIQAFIGAAPKTIDYRVNAGPIPDGHWYHDPRHGGRIVGEACHSVDTCAAIVGAAPASIAVHAPGAGRDDAVLSLTFPEGSVASVVYSSHGHPRTPKERIEVFGGGHTALVDDFRSLTLDGRRHRLRRQAKGFSEEANAFRRMLDDGAGAEATAVSLAAMRALLLGLNR